MINHIPNSVILKLVNCFLNSMNEAQFRNYTGFIDGIIAFEDLTENNGYIDDLPAYILSLKKRKQLGHLIKAVLEQPPNDAPDDPDYLMFLNALHEVFEKDLDAGKLKLKTEFFNNCLLGRASFPFIDRDPLRGVMAKVLNDEKSNVVFVNGEPKSGMSYLSRFFEEICAKTKVFRLFEIEIPYYFEADELNGESLASLIAEKVDLQVTLDDAQKDKFKFTRFITLFNKFIESIDYIPIIFIHDFHKVIVPESINKFIFEFVKEATRIDKEGYILILAGFNYTNIRNWHTDLKYAVNVHDLTPFSEQDVKDFLEEVFTKYEDKIKELGGENMTLNDYIEGMLGELGVLEEVNISRVGNGLKSHLSQLNS